MLICLLLSSRSAGKSKGVHPTALASWPPDDIITLVVLGVTVLNRTVLLPIIGIATSTTIGDMPRADRDLAIGRPHGFFGVNQFIFAALATAFVGRVSAEGAVSILALGEWKTVLVIALGRAQFARQTAAVHTVYFIVVRKARWTPRMTEWVICASLGRFSVSVVPAPYTPVDEGESGMPRAPETLSTRNSRTLERIGCLSRPRRGIAYWNQLILLRPQVFGRGRSSR